MNINRRKSGINPVKEAGFILARILLASLIGTVLLIGVYSLPTQRMEDNVISSAHTIAGEGAYPRLSDKYTSQLDNFTDSIMLLESAYPITSPVKDAMNAPRGYIEGSRPNEVLTAHYIDGKEFDRIVPYSRYWHGYLVFLKPLLQAFDYSKIRKINGAVQLFLSLLVCLLLLKKRQQMAVIPYILSYGMLMPLAIAKAFQYSSCFYVFTLGSIFLLLLPDEKIREKAYIVFLYCGIFTAYFDFLTYPIATFGVPMAFYLLLTGSDSGKDRIIRIVQNGLIWGAGYACMWAAKWLIGSILTGTNVIAEGLERVAMRTSSVSVDGAGNYGIMECEIKNIKAFLTTPVTVFVVICLVYLVFRCLKNRQSSLKRFVSILLPFLIIGLLPMMWYACTTNHSMIHSWFTNKACIVSLLSVLFGFVSLSQPGNRHVR